MLNFKELKDGKKYIAIGSDGRKYEGIFVNDYIPGGVFFCCYPHGVELLYFEEVAE
jgi:hypothetical protein